MHIRYGIHLVATGLDNNCARRYAMCSGEILRHASASQAHTIMQGYRGPLENPLSRLSPYNDVLDGERVVTHFVFRHRRRTCRGMLCFLYAVCLVYPYGSRKCCVLGSLLAERS